MLARASSDAGTRLRRSKSTSTVHKRPPSVSEPPHPDIGQQQALAAATAAFARSQAQNALDSRSKHNVDLTRSKSNASRKSISSQGSHFPPRDSSFRPTQGHVKGNITGAVRQTRLSTTVTKQFPPFYPLPSSKRPASAPRPLSTQPSITFSEQARPTSQAKMQRTSASSITSQQIRKARSMYYASSVQTGSPIARPPSKYLATPSVTSSAPLLENTPPRPPDGTSRPSSPKPPRVPATIEPNETIDQARDRYLQTFQQKTVRHRPSAFLAPFQKRQDKSKTQADRASSRTASVLSNKQQTPNESTTNVVLPESLPSHGPKEKRSFSGSLKSRIKKVFRRSSNRSSTLPVQQIEASRDYFEGQPATSQILAGLYDIPSPEEDILQRVRARTPSVEGVRPIPNRLGSRTSSNGSLKSNRSNRSLHSEVNVSHVSSSRVTSWGTNSTGDTLNQRAMKRLTVIHEAKDSIGSESDRLASMVPRKKSLPPLAAFRDPMPMESLVEEASTPVDPKRVFSALMREIDAANLTQAEFDNMERTPGAESDVFESSTTKELYSGTDRNLSYKTNHEERPSSCRSGSVAGLSTQSRASTLKSVGNAFRTTIRTMNPAVLSTSASSSKNLTCGPLSDVESPVRQSVSPEITDPQRSPLFTPSAAQLNKRKERDDSRWKTPLDDAERLGFPKETDRTYNVTKSPPQSRTPAPLGSLNRVTEPDLDISRPDPTNYIHPSEFSICPPSPPSGPIMSPLSPSVYSRNTDGMSILPNDSVMSFDEPEDIEHPVYGGSAVILTSQSVRSYVIGIPSPQRLESSRTSRDWKTWLSHEISGMSSISQENIKIDEHYLTPTKGGYKNLTRTSQTEREDTTVILRESCELTTPRQSRNTILVDGSLNHHDPTRSIESKARSSVEYQTCNSYPHMEPRTSTVHTPSSATKNQPGLHDTSRKSTPALKYSQSSPSPGSRESGSSYDVKLLRSAKMNERFPQLQQTHCSSSKSSGSSSHSMSPTESLASLQSIQSSAMSSRRPPRFSVTIPQQTPPRVSNTALKRSDAKYIRKENVTPPSVRGKDKANRSPNVSPPGLHPVQPLAIMNTHQNTSIVQSRTVDSPSPSATPSRPRVRASLRPVSPEKLARWPRSAFDLRGNRISQGPLTLYQTNIAELRVQPPRPVSELRRPGLHLNPSSGSLAQAKEPSLFTEERVIDTVIDGRGGSVTPGQRMADRFLKERKSTGVLEGSRMRGGLRLAREDTPAFL